MTYRNSNFKSKVEIDEKVSTAILQSACSVLNFDIGEFWLATKNPTDQRPSLKFIQLYTSPNYEDNHSLLIRPDHYDKNSDLNDDEKHKISPIICRGVCDGCQIVWASTVISEGLIGRKDLPLNSVVGVPVASIGCDLCIMVLFAVKSIYVSRNAIDYLVYLSRAVSENIPGFLQLAPTASPANADSFVGIWDIREYIKRFSDISFHLLPLGPLQSFFDFEDSETFRDIDIALTQSTAETILINNYKKDLTNRIDFSDSILPNNSKQSYMNLLLEDDNGRSSIQIEEGNHVFSSYVTNNSSVTSREFLSENSVLSESCIVNAYDSYKNPAVRGRFEQFMIAILKLTIFDAAELWFSSDKTQELFIVSSLHNLRDKDSKNWITQEYHPLRFGDDIPGIVIESSRPHWDKDYQKKNYCRSALATELGIKTVFGLPLPGTMGSCGCLVLFSRQEIEVVPLIITLVEVAVQLISASNLNPVTLSLYDIETLIHHPTIKLMGRLAENRRPSISESSHFTDSNKQTGLSDALLEAVAMLSSVDGSVLDSNGLQEHFAMHNKRKEIENSSNANGIKKKNSSESFSNISPASDSIPMSINDDLMHSHTNDFVALNENDLKCQDVASSDKSASPILSSRQCQFAGCTKCAQGATKFCISHGGGRRCTAPGCYKGARDKLFCCAHGGGKRCSVTHCSKSAVGGSTFCVNHGGGKRCLYDGCTKSSQSGTQYCVRHGGGKQCKIPGCNKVSRGKTEMCAAHGNTLL